MTTKTHQRKIALKKIIDQANSIILAWGDNARIKSDGIFVGNALPPLYQIMAYQGEAILLGRFFGIIRQKIGIETDHQDYLKFWRHSIYEVGFLLDFISRTQWLTVLQINTAVQPLTNEQVKMLYCILLAVVAERSPAKIGVVCDDFFLYLYKQQFPSESTERKATTTDQLRHKLTHKLRRLRNLPCEVKESFTQEPNKVVFTLLYRDDNKSRYKPLITLDRPRLKTARLAAYETLLDGDLQSYINGSYLIKSKQKRVVIIDSESKLTE